MDGYRQDNFDLDAGEADVKERRGRGWKQLVFAVAWVIPTFWLMGQDDYPDSFGVHYQSKTGRGQTAEDFYYSYLLLQRHHVLDVITFAFLWAPFLGLIGWIAYPQLRKLRHQKFSIYSDSSKGA
jgi:hypothetical protein